MLFTEQQVSSKFTLRKLKINEDGILILFPDELYLVRFLFS